MLIKNVFYEFTNTNVDLSSENICWKTSEADLKLDDIYRYLCSKANFLPQIRVLLKMKQAHKFVTVESVVVVDVWNQWKLSYTTYFVNSKF